MPLPTAKAIEIVAFVDAGTIDPDGVSWMAYASPPMRASASAAS